MTQYFDSVKCLIIDKEINDVSVLPKHFCDTTVRAPAKCMQNSAGVQMSPCLYAPWMCHMNRNAGSTTAPTHLPLASSLTRPRPRFWQSMCSALTSQRISHFSGASALFELHMVHGLKIYNTKTSVLHLKKSRKQFYCPLFFFVLFCLCGQCERFLLLQYHVWPLGEIGVSFRISNSSFIF